MKKLFTAIVNFKYHECLNENNGQGILFLDTTTPQPAH